VLLRHEIGYDDEEEMDLEIIKAQIYSMTDIEPNEQQFAPELTIQNLNQVLQLTIKSRQLLGIDSEMLLSSIGKLISQRGFIVV
jgi:hypothetical protein